MSKIKKLLMFAACILLLSIIWKPLVILLVCLLVIASIFWIVSLGKATKIRQTIQQNPQAYFNQQRHKNEDVIDVEYHEKVVDETTQTGGQS